MALPQFQDGTEEESMVMREISHLRTLVNVKLEGFEAWLSKLTEAVEKLADNRERTIVLESRMNVTEQKVIDHDRRIDKINDRQIEIDKRVTKHAVIIGAIVSSLNLVAIAAFKMLGVG